MSGEELRLLLRMARRPLSVALALIVLALLWLPTVGHLKRERETALAALNSQLDELRQKSEQLTHDLADLERLRGRHQEWQRRGLIARADRQAWFEALMALVGEQGKIELREPVALEGSDGALRHPLRIELTDVLDTEALALVRRLEIDAPAPCRIERIVLKERAETGLKAELEGALIHVDPDSVPAASLPTAPSVAGSAP